MLKIKSNVGSGFTLKAPARKGWSSIEERIAEEGRRKEYKKLRQL